MDPSVVQAGNMMFPAWPTTRGSPSQFVAVHDDWSTSRRESLRLTNLGEERDLQVAPVQHSCAGQAGPRNLQASWQVGCPIGSSGRTSSSDVFGGQ